MEHLKVKMFLVYMLMVNLTSADVKPISIARTELKVSRSLDPSTMQTVNVMTKDGSIAQLIVKRRDGKSQTTTTSSPRSPTNGTKSLQNTIQTKWIPIQTNIANQITTGNEYPQIPHPVTVQSSDVFVKNLNEAKRARSILQLGSDGIPIIHGVRMPDDDSDRQIWRNARVINGELVPYERGYIPQPAAPIGQPVFASKPPLETKDKAQSFGPFTTADNFALKSNIGPFTINDNRPELKPEENRNHYVRFSSDSGIGPFTKADNGRIANAKLIDYIRQINAQESKRDYFAAINNNNNNNRRYLQEEPTIQIQRRMLHYDGAHTYPNSIRYAQTSTKLNRINFNDGVRTPVLQYAHPELGVQPANAPTEDEFRYQTVQNSVTQDPEPISIDYSTNRGRNSHNNKYYTNYRKDVTYQPYYQPEVPLWFKITESIKDNFQHGIARMQQFTKPVLDPIVEATQKIGHNLGLNHMPANAEEKVGVVTPVFGGSVILPALGLVAGGAALGLGAAAVGRFLDVGNSRSGIIGDSDSYLDEMEMQHKRAINTYGTDKEIILLVESDNNQPQQQIGDLTVNTRRRKRSTNQIEEDDKYLQELMQSVKEDLSESPIASHLINSDKWTDTPCAKRMFCDIMTEQSYEEIAFMEKKMESFLALVHPVFVRSMSDHLQDVIEAVKQRDCSRFICQSTQKPKQ